VPELASIAIFFAAGAATGLYFRVFVLAVPIAAAFAVAAGAVLFGESLASAGIAFLFAAVFCQLGYLTGNLVRTLLSPADAGAKPDGQPAAGAPASRRRQSLRSAQLAPRQPGFPRRRRHPAG
jgi:hypothetical protein